MHPIDRRERGARMRTAKRLALAMLGLVALFWGIPSLLWSRGNASARRVALRVYGSAAKGYRGVPLSPEALATLRAWDAERGRPSRFRIVDSYTQILGRPSGVILEVGRGSGTYGETLGLPTSTWVASANEGRW